MKREKIRYDEKLLCCLAKEERSWYGGCRIVTCSDCDEDDDIMVVVDMDDCIEAFCYDNAFIVFCWSILFYFR